MPPLPTAMAVCLLVCGPAAAAALPAASQSEPTNDWRGVPRGAFIAPANAERGAGDAPRRGASVLASTAAPLLESLGEDVIRISSSPLMARRTFIIEAHRLTSGAAGTVTTFTLGKTNWVQQSQRGFTMTAADYERLSASVDALMAERLPPGVGDDEVVVCADDAVFMTERLRDGNKTWLSGDYGPNYRLAKTLIAASGVRAFDPAPKGYCGDRD